MYPSSSEFTFNHPPTSYYLKLLQQISGFRIQSLETSETGMSVFDLQQPRLRANTFPSVAFGKAHNNPAKGTPPWHQKR